MFNNANINNYSNNSTINTHLHPHQCPPDTKAILYYLTSPGEPCIVGVSMPLSCYFFQEWVGPLANRWLVTGMDHGHIHLMFFQISKFLEDRQWSTSPISKVCHSD